MVYLSGGFILFVIIIVVIRFLCDLWEDVDARRDKSKKKD